MLERIITIAHPEEVRARDSKGKRRSNLSPCRMYSSTGLWWHLIRSPTSTSTAVSPPAAPRNELSIRNKKHGLDDYYICSRCELDWTRLDSTQRLQCSKSSPPPPSPPSRPRPQRFLPPPRPDFAFLTPPSNRLFRRRATASTRQARGEGDAQHALPRVRERRGVFSRNSRQGGGQGAGAEPAERGRLRLRG